MNTTVETEQEYVSTATTTQSDLLSSPVNLSRRHIAQSEKDFQESAGFSLGKKPAKMPGANGTADSVTGSYPEKLEKPEKRRSKRERAHSPDGDKRDSKVQYTTGTFNDPSNEYSASGYTWPIAFALIPALGGIFYGSADLWSDILLLLLLGYYLYQIVKLPWELYHAARTRRILHDTATTPGSNGTVNPDKELPPHLQKHRQNAGATLRRQELVSLLFVVVSPFIGGLMLDYVRSHLSPSRVLITNFNISLFVLASSIRPITHVAVLLKKRALHLQEVVNYPSTDVEIMKRQIAKLEEDLSLLKKSHATKKDLTTNLTNVVQPELNTLSKTLKRVEKKEQFLRSYSEERFQYMETKMREFDAFVAYQLEQEALHKQVSLPVVALRTVTGAVFLPVNVLAWVLRGVGGVLPGMGKRRAIASLE